MSNSNKSARIFVQKFSNQINEHLDPISIPFAVSRNSCGYLLSTNNLSSMKMASVIAHKQALLFADSLSENPIPHALLRDTIENDLVLSNEEYFNRLMQSTVLGVSVGNKNMFIHTAGEHLDHIVLRDSTYTNANDCNPQPGFTLPLGMGSPLLQILDTGCSHANSNPHILARTSTEIFHLNATSVEGHFVRGAVKRARKLTDKQQRYLSNPNTTPYESVILEPVQKWQLPAEIADMSTASDTAWSHASVLARSGAMFTWSPGQGVTPCNGGRSVVPSSSGGSGDTSRFRGMKVECSSHPQISYITQTDSVLLYDMRRPGPAFIVMRVAGGNEDVAVERTRVNEEGEEEDIIEEGTNHSRSRRKDGGDIKCIKQHVTNRDQLLLSHNKTVSVMDVRYPRTALSERSTGETHETMKYRQMPNDRHTGVYLGSSKHAQQILAHTMSDSQSTRHQMKNLFSSTSTTSGNRSGTQGSTKGSWGMLGTATIHGASHGFAWDINGFPVIDSTPAHLAASLCDPVTMTGFDLVPYSNRSQHKSSKGSRDSSQSQAVHSRQKRGLSRDFSDSEESYTQQDDEDEDELGGDKEVEKTFNSLLIQQSSVGDVFAQRMRWTDRSTGKKESGSYGPRSSSPFQSPFSRSQRANTVPVQMNLPCGVRCESLVPSSFQSKKSFVSSSGYKVLTLQSSLTAHDLLSVYPHTSSVVTPHIPEDATRGHDEVRVVVADLRRDRPPVFKDRAAFVDVLPAPLEEEEEVDYYMAHGVAEQLLERLRRQSCGLTLFEVWKTIIEMSAVNRKQRIEMSVLRAYLSQNTDLQEVLLTGGLCHRVSGNSAAVNVSTVHKCRCGEDLMELLQRDGAVPSSSAELCEDIDCIVPHLLVYELMETLTQRKAGVAVSLYADSDYHSAESGAEDEDTVRRVDRRTKAGKIVTQTERTARVKEESSELSQDADRLFSTQESLLFSDDTRAPVPFSQSSRQSVSGGKGSKRGRSGVTSDMVGMLSERWDDFDIL